MENVVVYDVNDARLGYLESNYGIKSASSVDTAVEGSDIILLAVKPQNVESVAQALTVKPSGLILSIVAGYPIEKLAVCFHSKQIVRSMPNTPAMVSFTTCLIFIPFMFSKCYKPKKLK
jgi:pyrroline-5-carboxylate reductase